MGVKKTLIYTAQKAVDTATILIEKRHVRHGLSFERVVDHTSPIEEKFGYVRRSSSALQWATSQRFPDLRTGRNLVDPWVLYFGAQGLSKIEEYCKVENYVLAIPNEGLDILLGADRLLFEGIKSVLFAGQQYTDNDRYTGALCLKDCMDARPLLDVEHPRSMGSKVNWWVLAYKVVRQLR
jgi:hypothetical protein